MKVLNLYSGIGGNRKLWPSWAKVTAVEINPDIAQIYKRFFPQDHVIIGDAHQFLLEHFNEYDFIWSSPPCPTHSRINHNLNHKKKGIANYPDMRLYQEIILLKYNAKCDWVIENVKPYYSPLIQPSFVIDRHLFWSNRFIMSVKIEKKIKIQNVTNKTPLEYFPEFQQCRIENKKTVIRNTMNPEIGKYIFDSFFPEGSR